LLAPLAVDRAWKPLPSSLARRRRACLLARSSRQRRAIHVAADRALEAAQHATRLKMANVARYDVGRTCWPSWEVKRRSAQIVEFAQSSQLF